MCENNSKSICTEASRYYYDYLRERINEHIPEHIIDHIRQCDRCTRAVEQLGAEITLTKQSQNQSQYPKSKTDTMLALHLTCIGEKVTCKMVRLFLPTLLEPLFAIRVPTPITAHIERCEQCRGDLEIIRQMDLDRARVARLSLVFADKASRYSIKCNDARRAVPSVAEFDFSTSSNDVLTHLCICPACRTLLYERRQALLQEMASETPQKNGNDVCRKVSKKNIFDFMVPYNLDSTSRESLENESLASHIRTCSTCMAKLQHLHNTVYGILDRAESGVVTEYQLDESIVSDAAYEAAQPYPGLPIKIQTITAPKTQKSGKQTSKNNILGGHSRTSLNNVNGSSVENERCYRSDCLGMYCSVLFSCR